jgi:hypothetical protein
VYRARGSNTGIPSDCAWKGPIGSAITLAGERDDDSVLGRTWEDCNETVIVHDDRSFTCSNNDCTITASVEVVVSFHTSFVACRSVFAQGGCPRCGWHLFLRSAR